MLRVILILVTVSVIAALPAVDDVQAKIINYENENDGTGNYHFSFETSNGLTREETGILVNPGQPDEHIEVQGRYTYIDDAGETHFVNYFAGQNGFQIIPEVIEMRPGQASPSPDVTDLPPSAVASLLG